jgi:hypothetical protein
VNCSEGGVGEVREGEQRGGEMTLLGLSGDERRGVEKDENRVGWSVGVGCGVLGVPKR